MKYILVFVIIIYSSFVSAKIIAEVGNCRITSIELQSEIDELVNKHEYSYGSTRQIAFNNLIDNCLISNYATEKGIIVDDSELEAFFIQQVGDLPRFQTNGAFSEQKFFHFKNSRAGRNVLKAMRKELRITKARTILEESFEISEAKLLRQYFFENTNIDLGYAIIDKQDIDFEIETLPEDFEWYFRRNKHKYNKEEKIKLDIFVVLNEEFEEAAIPIVNRQLTQMILSDSTLHANDTHEIRNDMLIEQTQKLARQKAVQVSELLQANANISQTIIESSYLSKSDKLGNLPDVILSSAFEMDEGQYSEPILIDEGYLVYKVIDKRKISIKDEQAVAKLIWQDYIAKEINSINDDLNRKYFEENFEKFIIPTVIVTKIEISNPSLFSSTTKEEYQQEIKHLLETNADDEFKISRIVRDNNLSESKENIYLKKFDNASIVDDMIAIRMNRGEEWGFIPTGKKILFYKALSFFPEFIPSYKKISDQLPRFITYSKTDSTDYREYYDSHKRDFRTPDSLQIGGVVYSIQKEYENFAFTLSDNEINKIYDKRMNIRGLHLDPSRRPLTINTVLNIIDKLGACGINTLHLHLSDDQGFAIESEVLDFHKGWSIEEQNMIYERCKQYNIDIIPEIDIPGHTIALRSIFEGKYEPLEKMGTISHGLINLDDMPKILDLFTEVHERFHSKYFHMGGDETKGAKKVYFQTIVDQVCEWANEHDIIPIAWE
ncbi:MAG: family 20 glycosylhydrolase, partial [Candidatus Cloacimonetes bacterium]|nr:family 20 glycosylhydrolase [Candidatus Cloacimonadota bacterium]